MGTNGGAEPSVERLKSCIADLKKLATTKVRKSSSYAAKLIEINPVPQATDKRQLMTKAIKTYQKQHQQAITTTQVLPKVKNAKIEI